MGTKHDVEVATESVVNVVTKNYLGAKIYFKSLTENIFKIFFNIDFKIGIDNNLLYGVLSLFILIFLYLYRTLIYSLFFLSFFVAIIFASIFMITQLPTQQLKLAFLILFFIFSFTVTLYFNVDNKTALVPVTTTPSTTPMGPTMVDLERSNYELMIEKMRKEINKFENKSRICKIEKIGLEEKLEELKVAKGSSKFTEEILRLEKEVGEKNEIIHHNDLNILKLNGQLAQLSAQLGNKTNDCNALVNKSSYYGYWETFLIYVSGLMTSLIGKIILAYI